MAGEGRDSGERERELLAGLPGFLECAQRVSAACGERFAGVDVRGVDSRAALAELPVTVKADLIAEQERTPPFGGYDCFGESAPQRFYMSPGPIAECDFAGADYWRTAAAFYALGLRAGMTLHNCFSYHFTPAGAMCDSGALALGCSVFPAGPGNSEQQTRAIARFRPGAYSGTPDFLQTILRRAEENGADCSSLTMASVSGGYLSPQLREFYFSRGIRVLQFYGSAEFGAIAFESAADKPMIVSEGLLVEVVDPVSRAPVAEGEKGEVLVTNFNRAYPLVRFATGDLSAVVPGISDCGRTNMRLAGWLGRCDPAVKIRGVFVHPAQVGRLAEKFALAGARLRVFCDSSGRDAMILQAQLSPGDCRENARGLLTQGLRDETGLRGEVEIVAEVSSGDGGGICDERKDGGR